MQYALLWLTVLFMFATNLHFLSLNFKSSLSYEVHAFKKKWFKTKLQKPIVANICLDSYPDKIGYVNEIYKKILIITFLNQ